MVARWMTSAKMDPSLSVEETMNSVGKARSSLVLPKRAFKSERVAVGMFGRVLVIITVFKSRVEVSYGWHGLL